MALVRRAVDAFFGRQPVGAHCFAGRVAEGDQGGNQPGDREFAGDLA